jgi:hypothetical protein
MDRAGWPRGGTLLMGALLAALAVGCGGSASTGSRPQSGSGSTKVWKPAIPDTAGPILAVVGGRKVTRHEIDSLITTAPQNVQDQLREFDSYRDVVDRVVSQEAILVAAKAAGVDKDPVYLAEVARTSRELMGRRLWDIKVKEMPPVPDSTLKAYYDSHTEEFTMSARSRIRHIEVATRKKALQVRTSLQKGGLWDETCRKQSIDGATKQNGGLLGYVAGGGDQVPGIGKSPAIAAAAFALPVGEVSQPLKGPKSWHLIRVEDRQEKTVQPFEETRATIRMRLDAERRDAFGKAFVESTKAAANAVIFDDSIRLALKPPKTAADLFKEAQSAATPTQRIQLYRALVKEFPQDTVSVQAQFMVGFTFAEELGDYESARVEFEQFLKDHPGTELAESARWMLENMEKPPPALEGEPDGGGSKQDGGAGGKHDGTDSSGSGAGGSGHGGSGGGSQKTPR